MTDDPRAWRKHLRRTLADLDAYEVEPVPGAIRLNANESPLPWPPFVLDDIARATREVELERYPDTSGRALRRALGERFDVAPERVVLGCGSDEIISFLLVALCDPARRGVLVVPSPTFVMYEHTARVHDYEIRRVALDDELQLDEAALDAALGGATIAFFARPNNPTSGLWDDAVLERLWLRHPDVIFVIDEAYIAYAPGASLVRPDAPSHVVFMGTASKIGLAALRVGWCIADAELARALNKVRHPYNVSQTSLAIAQLVLERHAETMHVQIESCLDLRARLVAMLEVTLARLREGGPAGLDTRSTRVFPAHGNLVLVRVGDATEAARWASSLRERGILVKDLSNQPQLAGCLRVSLGTPAELSALERALAQL
jgi:histidinol-phosphate aminotransferase